MARSVFEHHGCFVLRTPLVAHRELVELTAGLTAAAALPAAADDRALAAALAADRAVMRSRLRTWFERPAPLEALAVASPGLVERLPAWRADPDGEAGIKVERSLYKYAARMASRATPFGLFAGVSVGRIAEVTALDLGSAPDTRRTRLDMDYVVALASALEADPAIRAALRLSPNSSLYRAGARLRYAESFLAGELRSYRLVSVTPTDYLDTVLTRARHGATTPELVAALIAGRDDITADDARAYIDELVAAQVLVSELGPRLTGAAPLRDLVDALRRSQAGAAAAATLERAAHVLAELDARGVGAPLAAYDELHAVLATLPVVPARDRMVQVDLVTARPGMTLAAHVIAEIERGARVLARIGQVDDRLRQFRADFAARYADREVPLVEVLDEDSGIGFRAAATANTDLSPLLAGLPFAVPDPATVATLGPLHRFAFGQLVSALARGERELVIDEDALPVVTRGDRLPDAWSAYGTLSAASAAAIDRGEFTLSLYVLNGPSGAKQLGRFCDADPGLLACVRAHVAAEAALRPDAVFAEIVHLPDGRTGNINSRPTLLPYEIPYLGRSAVAADHQLSVDDLLVSVRGDRVVLRSRRLQREVIPRLDTAHDFTYRSLGTYRFLCTLQFQPGAPISDFWGPLIHAPFLPRVRVGKLVLEAARWTLSATHLDRLRGPHRDPASRFRAVHALRTELALPRWIAVSERDNALAIDLDNAVAVDTFLHWIGDRTSVPVTEIFPGPAELAVTGPGGAYVHELLVPFVRTAASRAALDAEAGAPPVPPPARAPTATRSFAIGSAWLYVKLYASEATLDEILTEAIAPVVRDARARGAMTSWFFIRYADPDCHLRIRMRGDPQRLLAEVLPALHDALAPLREAGSVWKVQCDTYERELERYGGDAGIELAERLFEIDSDAVLAIVEALADPDAGVEPDARWQLGFLGLASLLDAFGLDLAACHRVAARTADARQTATNKPLAQALGRRYRAHKPRLDALLATATAPVSADRDDDPDPMTAGRRALAERHAKLVAVAGELRAAEAGGELAVPVDILLDSYMHMFCNRLFPAANLHELVLYELLARSYESVIARARRAAPSP